LNYPYYIYYRVHDDSIEIITVFHVKRDPDNLSKALEAPSPE
jgi:plasmid stabilization system protein ParE